MKVRSAIIRSGTRTRVRAGNAEDMAYIRIQGVHTGIGGDDTMPQTYFNTRSCADCRHYQDAHTINDRFFGEHTVKDWCDKYDHRIKDLGTAQSCLLFLDR